MARSMAGKCEELTIVTTGEARYLSRAEAAEFLTERGYKTAPSTLAKKAVVDGGPPFVSWVRKPLYNPESLLEWAQRRCTGLRRSTADRGEDGRCGETQAANSCGLERPIEEISVGMSPRHQKTDHPYPHPPAAGKGTPLNSEPHKTRNKNAGFSSARRNASEGVA